jgi:hypothetical protein
LLARLKGRRAGDATNRTARRSGQINPRGSQPLIEEIEDVPRNRALHIGSIKFDGDEGEDDQESNPETHDVTLPFRYNYPFTILQQPA